jgi:hypothetical protein
MPSTSVCCPVVLTSCGRWPRCLQRWARQPAPADHSTASQATAPTESTAKPAKPAQPEKQEKPDKALTLTAKEKAGHIRWLRPEFQNPAPISTLLNMELHVQANRGLQAGLALNDWATDVLTPSVTAAAESNATPSWPAALPLPAIEAASKAGARGQ